MHLWICMAQVSAREDPLERINHLFTNLNARQMMAFVAGFLALLATVGLMVWVIFRPSYALLYSGLDPSSSGDVLAVLDQRSISYDIRSDAIYVPQEQRDELRMVLAAEGLPKNTVSGYEILDNLSGFSTTAQMFDAAYWRAKEGELARTLMASPLIRSARVHIANTPSASFQSQSQVKASVSLSTPTGGLSVQHAQAIRYLVSSAVSNLAPKDVAVIDEQGGLIGDTDSQSYANSALDRSNDLRSKVERLLEPHVGFGNAVVEVSVETETAQQSIREKTVDPKSRVAISTQTVESAETQQNSGVTGVSVASNVPNTQATGSGGSQSQNNEIRETTNFEISETERQIVKGPGDVKRLSVAVLINQAALNVGPNADLENVLNKLSALVGSAVGLDPSRGDILTIETMDFQPIMPIDDIPVSGTSLLDRLNITQIIQVAIIAVVVIFIIQFVLRPLLRPATNDVPRVGANAGAAQIALETDIAIGSDRPQPKLGSNAGDRLRQMIGERQGDTVEILRTWLEEK